MSWAESISTAAVVIVFILAIYTDFFDNISQRGGKR